MLFLSPTGEGSGYRERALLIYDGIHYDPLVLEGVGGVVCQRVFPVSDGKVLEKALQLAREAFQVCVCVCVGHSFTFFTLMYVLCIQSSNCLSACLCLYIYRIAGNFRGWKLTQIG